MIFVGIDPGLGGALAVLWPDTSHVVFHDVPTLQNSKKPNRRDYDITAMDSLLLALSLEKNIHVGIEAVSFMPGRAGDGRVRIGAASAGLIGKGFGIWLGLLVARRVPYTVIQPATWKRNLMAGMPKEKSASILRAKQLFPKVWSELTLVKHHNRADALLLAEYVHRSLSLTK